MNSDEQHMLQDIRKTAQMGCYAIDALPKNKAGRSLQQALDAQFKEYDSIFQEADRLLRAADVEPRDIPTMARYGSMVASRMRIRASREPSAKIAEMMLQGNTKGMIKSLHNIRTCGVVDPKISSLSTRLLQTEQANIEQMKSHL